MEPGRQIQFIKEVLEEFNRLGMRYCLLRNYEFLLGQPNPVESLDTVVAEEDLDKIDQILKQFGFIKRKQQFSLKHKAYFQLVNLKKVSFDIQVGGVHWNDICYLDETIIKNRVRNDFFYAPDYNETFLMLLTHSILGKRSFKPKYQKILLDLLQDDKIDEGYVLDNLTRIFNRRIAEYLFDSIKKDEFNRINKMNIYLLITYFILKKPRRILTLSALSLRWLRWKKFLRPSPLISFVGPDGAGKSTAVEGLRCQLESQGRKTITIYLGRGRDHFLPISKAGRKYKTLEKKKSELMKNCNKNSFLKQDKKLLYTLASPIFAIDLLLRYYFIILPQRLKKNIVITDRYCSDIVLMDHVHFSFRKILLKLFPKPTISIFLYHNPEILHQRRPEESIEELERQTAIFNNFDYSLKLQTVDKKNDLEKVSGFVFSKLLQDWY